MYDAAFNNIENTLRAEDGIANELDYVEQISWLLFLKYLSDLEAELANELAAIRSCSFFFPRGEGWRGL